MLDNLHKGTAYKWTCSSLNIVWSEISFVGVQCVDICHQGTQYECEADLILIIIIFLILQMEWIFVKWLSRPGESEKKTN